MNKRNRTSDNSPSKLPYEMIKCITNNFSEELGQGSFGKVFKGVLEDGEEIAVKMLRLMADIDGKHFENEFEILKRLKHPNIVQLVGFCDEAEEEFLEYKGKLIVCQRIHRALCLEYMVKGSLGKLLTGENLGKNWPTRYNIIKGICEGLKYLREGLEFPISHFDLKPDNILLNEMIIPKISDFGLSRLIGEENTKKTLTPLGTVGYLPPEFINYQVISKEYDIYSLGVIITKIIVTGIIDYSDAADMAAEEFVEHVCRTRFTRMTHRPAALPYRELVRSKKQKSTTMHNDLPSEICHPAHPEHKLKLTTDAGVPFLCDGCKEPGCGPRYTCDSSGEDQSLELHRRCVLADDPLFDLRTQLLPIFGYGKQFEFRFLLHEPPPPADEGKRVCDACGEATRGFVYHCSGQDVNIHPCCASLPDRIIQDGRAFDLHRRASRPCALCPENEDQRRWFWAYRCNHNGDVAAVDLHVACLKETARRSWEDVGDGVLNGDGMLENKFGEVAGTVASFITALVSGNLIVKM